MMKLRVTVVPVVLRPIDEDARTPQLAVSMLRPAGKWLATTVSDTAGALEAARRMLDDAVLDGVEAELPGEKPALRLENAGVEYSFGEPNLLFSVVLPIAAAELSGQETDWSLLTPWVDDNSTCSQLRSLDPVRAAIIAYWRGQLLQTTAAFDFLPKYFPTSQVRSVYASVWGENQADGNFQRWLASARDVMGDEVCVGVIDEKVRQETQAAFAERLAGVGFGLTTATLAKAWDPKFVGLSAGVGALAGVGAMPAAVVAGAIVGSLVGWQRARGTGRPPTWYRRTNADRVDLKTWYPVRPPAAEGPSMFVG